MNDRFGLRSIVESTGVLLRATVRLEFAFDGSALRSRTILKGMAGLLCIGTLALVLSAALNHRAISEANTNVATIVRGGGALYNNPGWAGRLLFPAYFLLLFAVWTSVRYGLLSIVEQSGRSWSMALTISVLGLVPLAASGILQGLVNNLFPVLPSLADSALPLLRVYGAIALTVGVFLWEGILVARGLSRAVASNSAKGVLVWLAPYIALILLFVAATALLSIIG